MDQMPAQGWYVDPFGLHEHRYFSAGQPTKLVRDSGGESYDPPPDEPLPGPLVPVEEHDEGDASDLRRADELEQAGPYESDESRRAAFDAFDQTAGTD